MSKIDKNKLLEYLKEEKEYCEKDKPSTRGYHGDNVEAFMEGEEGQISGKLDIIEELIYSIEHGEFD